MKTILLLTVLLSTGLMAQESDSPTSKEVAAALAVYGMASMMTDAILPVYDTYNAKVISSLVKVTVIIAAKWYADKERPGKVPPILLQMIFMSMAYHDIKVRGGF